MSSLPYARTLGLSYRREAEGIVIVMPFSKQLVGAPSRLHGGTVAGLLEIASIAQLVHVLGREETAPGVKPINVTVDYLRAAACETTYAGAVVTRLGRRIANVRAEAWQTDRGAPVAAAHMNVMLVRE
ncbi:MAG: PaaI family thioesterase [Sphingomonadaceae bacterium]|nr:PaaI family thioesterase [Sphingomonadaceae bacterium]